MTDHRVSIIAAIDDKRGLGKNGELLFRIRDDMKRLRAITNGHPLVMGRKTFDSFPGLLPNRTHIVISRHPEVYDDAAVKPHFVVSSLEEGLEVAKGVAAQSVSSSGLTRGSSNVELDSRPAHGESRLWRLRGNDGVKEIFIFGGGQIFTEAVEKGFVDRLYLTIVKGDFGADTFFPDYSMFTKEIDREEKEGEGFQYTFLTLEK